MGRRLTPEARARAEFWARIVEQRQRYALQKDRERVAAEVQKARALRALQLARDQGARSQ